MNKIYLFEIFVGLLMLISSSIWGLDGRFVYFLSIILFLPPFNYHSRSLDERELILELKAEQITGHLLIIFLLILFIFPNFVLGGYKISEIWFLIAFGFKTTINGLINFYLFNNNNRFDSIN